MKEISIIGVSRGSQYSPNHVGNDAAIFNLVADELRKLGCQVTPYSETEFVEKNIQGDFIFDMARDAATIKRLKELEDEGALVINSAYGITDCVRKPMTLRLIESGVPHPESMILSTEESYPGTFFPCWFKRGDSHAMVKEDVAYATNQQEADAIMADFRSRGIPEAVVNKHLEGDLVKFYGVQGTDFFYWFYPGDCSHSKFGLEKINGEARGFSFNVDQLKEMSNRAADALNVPVYGGDCVVRSNGEIAIIDFNDWPSFARCRDEAAMSIAACIYQRVKKRIDNE